jgi:hypothetical protein
MPNIASADDRICSLSQGEDKVAKESIAVGTGNGGCVVIERHHGLVEALAGRLHAGSMHGMDSGTWKHSIDRGFGSVRHGSVGTADEGSVEGELISI